MILEIQTYLLAGSGEGFVRTFSTLVNEPERFSDLARIFKPNILWIVPNISYDFLETAQSDTTSDIMNQILIS